MEALLKSSLAYYTGTCDRTGHPIIAAPRSGQDALLSTSADDVVRLVRRFIDLAPVQQKLNGFSIVADLSSSTIAVAERLIDVLGTLQSENTKAISGLLLVKPSSWKRRRQLAKLTGYRDVKKGRPPKTPFQVLTVKDVRGLQQHADRSSLLEELGGTVHINKDLWVQFYTGLDSAWDACEKCLAASDHAKRQAQEMSQLHIPAAADAIAELVAKVDGTYEALFEQLKLDAAIDGCMAILSKIQPPDDRSGIPKSPQITSVVAASSALTRLFHADLLREVARRTTMQQAAVTELRERLQMARQQAKARLVQASQLCEHRKQARKVCKWISGTALPRLQHLRGVPNSMSEMKAVAQFLDDEFRECIKSDAVEPAERIFTDVEYMAMQDSAEVQQSQSFVDQLRDSVQQLNDALTSAEQILRVGPALLESIEQLSSWTSIVATKLPAVPVVKTGSGSASSLTGSSAWLESCAAVIAVVSTGHALPTKATLNRAAANVQYLRSESRKRRVQKLLRGAAMLIEISCGNLHQVDEAELAAWCADWLRREGTAVEQVPRSAVNSDSGFNGGLPPGSYGDMGSSSVGSDNGSSVANPTDDMLGERKAASPQSHDLSKLLLGEADTSSKSTSAKFLGTTDPTTEPDYILLHPADIYEPATFARDFVPLPTVPRANECTSSTDLGSASIDAREQDDNLPDPVGSHKAAAGDSHSLSAESVACNLAATTIIPGGREQVHPVHPTTKQHGSGAITTSVELWHLDGISQQLEPKLTEPTPSQLLSEGTTEAASLFLEPAAVQATARLLGNEWIHPGAPKLTADFKAACQREQKLSDTAAISNHHGDGIAVRSGSTEPAAAATVTGLAITATTAANVAAPCRGVSIDGTLGKFTRAGEPMATLACRDVRPTSAASGTASCVQPSPLPWWQQKQQPYAQALDDIEHDQYLTPEQKLAQMVDLIESVDLSSDEPCYSYYGSIGDWTMPLPRQPLLYSESLPPEVNTMAAYGSDHRHVAAQSCSSDRLGTLCSGDGLGAPPTSTSVRTSIRSSSAQKRCSSSSSPDSISSQKHAFKEWSHAPPQPSGTSTCTEADAPVLEIIRRAELLLLQN